MIMHWISGVPSKMLKIVDYRAISTGQRPADRYGISMDSVPAVQDE
jgi:hypothetical protein